MYRLKTFVLLLLDSLQHSVGPEQCMCIMLANACMFLLWVHSGDPICLVDQLPGDHLCQQVHSI